MSPLETRFVADVMLGRLAKWLRVMGCDTHYQPFYGPGMINAFVCDGRLLLSRNKGMINRHTPSFFIGTDHVGTQLREIIKKGYISQDNSQWFTRCLVCNTPLKVMDTKDVRPHVPEYVFSYNYPGIHFCPSCRRYFWPGTHKTRMLNQISEWNLFSS